MTSSRFLIKTGSVKFDLKFNIYRFKIDIFPIWEEYHLARQLILFEIAKDYKTWLQIVIVEQPMLMLSY